MQALSACANIPSLTALCVVFLFQREWSKLLERTESSPKGARKSANFMDEYKNQIDAEKRGMRTTLLVLNHGAETASKETPTEPAKWQHHTEFRGKITPTTSRPSTAGRVDAGGVQVLSEMVCTILRFFVFLLYHGQTKWRSEMHLLLSSPSHSGQMGY